MFNEKSESSFRLVRPFRILLLTYYFPPEQTPGAFRSEALLNALLVLGKQNSDFPIFVDVLTSQPNRYRTSTNRAEAEHTGPSYRIRRVSLPSRATGYVGEGRNFVAFASGVRKAVKHDQYDLVFATTSRQMTGLLGAWIAARKGSRLYLDIRDLFVQNLKKMFPWPLLPTALVANVLERWMLQRADRISIVSEGFLASLRSKMSAEKISFFPNGIDDMFILRDKSLTKVDFKSPTKIVYAGNIGAGQELHRVIPQLADHLRERVRFEVFGDGRQLAMLRAAVVQRGLTNVVLNPPVAREKLPAIYARADVLFLNLGRAASLEGVLPSKVFEYAASGRPIMAGVSGYAARFIEEEIENSVVFSPGDAEAALLALPKLRISHTDRRAFVRRFSRTETMRLMAEEIFSLAKVNVAFDASRRQ